MAPPRVGAFDDAPPPPSPPPRTAPIPSPTTAIRPSSPHTPTAPTEMAKEAKETPSPPAKRRRRRGSSTPPPSSPPYITPARSRSLSPPPPITRGRSPTVMRASSPQATQMPKETPPLQSSPRHPTPACAPSPTRQGKDQPMSSISEPGVNTSMIRKQLLYSPDSRKENHHSCPDSVKKNHLSCPPVGIFWDIENCPIPRNSVPQNIYGNVIRALSNYGKVTKFCLYTDLRLYLYKDNERFEEVKMSGVQAEHCPHDQKKEVVDKVMIVEMLSFGLDNPIPACVMLISGDADFYRALRALGNRGYTIGLAIPFDRNVKSELTSAADVVWDWTSLACGQGVGVPRCLAPPDDVEAVKNEIRNLLLSADDDSLSFSQIREAYAICYHKPLIVTNYGCNGLEEFFENLGQNNFLVIGGREHKFVSINPQISSDEAKVVRDLTNLQDGKGGCEHKFVSITPQISSDEAKAVRDLTDMQDDKDIAVPTAVLDDENVTIVYPTEDVATKEDIAVPASVIDDLNINIVHSTEDVTTKEETDVAVLQTVLETGPSTRPPKLRYLRQRPRRRVDLG